MQELEKHIDTNFPVPSNEMQQYYEKLITGRVLTEYIKKVIREYKESLKL